MANFDELSNKISYFLGLTQPIGAASLAAIVVAVAMAGILVWMIMRQR